MPHPKRNENPAAQRPKASDRAIDIVIEKAWAQGWWIERAKKKSHFKCLSPSDWRGIKNARSLLRKYGLKM